MAFFFVLAENFVLLRLEGLVMSDGVAGITSVSQSRGAQWVDAVSDV